MVKLRPRVKHSRSFEERLADEAKRLREAAGQEPPGSARRELLLRRARQTETAGHLNQLLSSPGLQQPK
jgi:hypothetical protein